VKRRLRALITAGPTIERLDSVRFISNFSTGNMGYELAKAALRRGYKVTLISGPTNLQPPAGANFINIESARDMRAAVNKNFKESDCVFMASAVCDWRPERPAEGKIKKGPKRLSLRLVRNPDILGGMGRHKDGRLLVGFALESDALTRNAIQKLRRKNLDLIVANKIGRVRTPFGSGKTDVVIIDRCGGQRDIRRVTKKRIAEEVLDRAESLWEERR
jgi:phosphopantothenoylcysteine decarboxylase/phosphopantothenate--cysteine ligase